MKKVISKACLSFTLTLFVFAFIQRAEAIPTFARKYRTSCTTCHIGFNRLNPFGGAYRQNGYQIPQAQEVVYVKEEPVSLGAPAWKKVWPEGVWPGAIPQFVPISMMVHQRTIWNESASSRDVAEVNFSMPHEWELIIGGNFGDIASFFGEFVLVEDGNVEGVQRLFLQLNDLLAGPYDILPEDALNLKLGYFDIAADPFPNPIRRTLNRYLPSDYVVGGGGFKLRNSQGGLELNGVIKRRLRYALGLVNGNSSKAGDDNSQKDPYWRLAYKWGGLAFDGSGEELGEELKQTENWVDNAFTLGSFGYYGKETVSSSSNDLQRLGFDCHLQWQDFDFSGAMVFGEDDDPNATGIGVDTQAWFTQLEYIIYPWLISTLRYEQLDYDDTTNDLKRLIPSLAIYGRANIRIILEGVIYPDGEDGSNALLADVAFAF
ncbi:MAG: hypothetical protein NG712_05960 [Omnitrophica bacterium]|nr:hypothetical protein [Candidatus Omnitrophota bacterium]